MPDVKWRESATIRAGNRIETPPVVEASRMDTDLKRVIVTISGSSTAACVHHRDFPEIRAEAGSPEEAAAHLVNKLACALDSA